MPIIRFFVSVVLIFSFFNSCKKEDLPEAGGQQLQKIIIQFGDTISYTLFDYNKQNNLLVAITDSNNNGNVWKTFIEYNILNQPVKFKSDSLIYENNRVVKKISTTYPYPVLNTYSYGAQNRLITDTAYYNSGGIIYTNYTKFTSDNNSNIVQWQTFYKSPSGSISSNGIITASYDGEINAYSSLGLAAYFIRGDIFLLSNQNRKQTNYLNGVTENYQYEYYSNGLPRKAVVQNRTGGQVSAHNIEFFYE